MHRFSRLLAYALALVAVIQPAACEDAVSPSSGALTVAVTTTGNGNDADGFFVGIDQEAVRPIGMKAAVTYSGLMPRTYTVLLTGLAPNCHVDGANPRLVHVAVGGNTRVTFWVECGTPDGGDACEGCWDYSIDRRIAVPAPRIRS